MSEIVVVHICGHVRTYAPHPNESVNSLSRITESESKRECLNCIRAKENKRE